jgi:hypothetical protein
MVMNHTVHSNSSNSALKKAQQEAEKTERAHQRAVAKDTRDINAEMARMAKVYKRLFD